MLKHNFSVFLLIIKPQRGLVTQVLGLSVITLLPQRGGQGVQWKALSQNQCLSEPLHDFKRSLINYNATNIYCTNTYITLVCSA